MGRCYVSPPRACMASSGIALCFTLLLETSIVNSENDLHGTSRRCVVNWFAVNAVTDP